jgi:hypothetical protein
MDVNRTGRARGALILLSLLWLGCHFELPVVEPGGDAAPPDGSREAGRDIAVLEVGADAAPPGNYRPAPGQICSQDNWCWENPLPTGNALYDVTGSETELWVAGAHTALHFDGQRWRHADYHGHGRLYDLLDDGAGGFHVASDPGILHFDGQAWLTEYKEFYFRALWRGAGAFFAAGGYGALSRVARKQAGSWSDVTPSGASGALNGVWGAGGDLFVVGVDGQIFHYDGSAWAKVDSGVDMALNDVWGTGLDDIWAVGSGGTILHRGQAGTWQRKNSTTSSEIYAIWGRGAGDAFAVGRSGTILRLEGEAWGAMSSPVTERHLLGVGAVGQEVWATGDGGTLLRFDGTTWSEVSIAVTRGNLRDAHGVGDDLFAVGFKGGGLVLRRSDGGWSVVHTGKDYLEGVFALAATDVWAVGWKGAILHHDGTTWKTVASNTSNTLRDLWGDGPGNLYAVGDGGTILRHDGSGWKPMDSKTTASLTGVVGTASGEVFAVGAGGTVLHLEGGVWSKVASPGTSNDLHGVWADGPKAVFAVGDSGTVLRFDGTGWSAIGPEHTKSLEAVWGRSATDLYVAGYGGYVAHFDGSSWTELKCGVHSGLTAVWGNASGTWLVGGLGVILHHE